MKNIIIINGPNIEFTGTRNVNAYGKTSLQEYLDTIKSTSILSKLSITELYLNSEKEIIESLHSAKENMDGIIINPGAFTHSSLAIADALEYVSLPTVEVHISNVYKRQFFRRTNYISAQCIGTISGLGVIGYKLALLALLEIKSISY